MVSGGAISVGPTGPTGPQGPAGPAGLFWKGTWVSGTSYVLNDAVGYNGASYFCILATSGTTTPNLATTAWALLASQGAVGPAGATGATGATGNTGAVGPAGGAGTLQQTVDNGNNIITGTTKTTLNGTSISIIDTDTLLGNVLYKDSLRFNRDNGSGSTKRIDLLSPSIITDNRTITFPDASGIVALLPTVAGNYANDTAAAAAGIAIGSLYHTAGVVKVRLT